MTIDNRAHKILIELATNNYLTSNLLEKQFQLTRRQISYSIQKINEYLTSIGLEPIKRLKNGGFIISDVVINKYKSQAITTNVGRYIFSEYERTILIIFYLIIRDRKISLLHLSSFLKVSQNTILSDIKKSKSLLAKYNVRIDYDRQTGYFIFGDEIDKRYILLELIKNILAIPNYEKLILELLNETEEIINKCKYIFNKIEEKQKIKLTDQQLNILIYFTCATIVRINHGKTISRLPNNYIEKNNKLLPLVSEYLAEIGIHNNYEQCFFSLLLKSSNIYQLIDKNYNIDFKLFNSAREVVDNFEKIVCVTFEDKEELIYRIYQHWKPAFYRITYNIETINSAYDIVIREFNHLHELVKRSLTPFENIVAQNISDEEASFFTVLFGGWLTREGLIKKIKAKKIAIVVCDNSATISNYLLFKLQTLLPELHFDGVISLREYENYARYHDVVFSTNQLNTKCSLFIIDSTFKIENKTSFRNQVLCELQGVKHNALQLDSILAIIEKTCVIQDKKELVDLLGHYLFQTEKKSKNSDLKHYNNIDIPSLKHLLPIEHIIIATDDNLTWQQAIQQAAQPLLKAKIIYQKYINTIIEKIYTEQPYIMLADKIIIAHAGIDDGVNDIGMTILKLPTEININNYLSANIIIVLATNNVQRHLKALSQLNDFLEFNNGVNKLRNAEQAEDIYNEIKNYT